MPRHSRRSAVVTTRHATYKKSIESISDFFAAIDGLLPADQLYWYRGHADSGWRLTPAALRLKSEESRKRALALHHEFRRLAVLRLTMAPPASDELQWIGLAQHYGLPTRLLDWTENPAIALYFATLHPDRDGVVYILNPLDLNRRVDPRDPRIFDAARDERLIASYFKLGALQRPRGKISVAINPVYNSERIVLQRGVFTLHGDRDFELDGKQAPSLVALPVSRESKAKLSAELGRIGINEMSMFPEPEHICTHLRRRSGL